MPSSLQAQQHTVRSVLQISTKMWRRQRERSDGWRGQLHSIEYPYLQAQQHTVRSVLQISTKMRWRQREAERGRERQLHSIEYPYLQAQYRLSA